MFFLCVEEWWEVRVTRADTAQTHGPLHSVYRSFYSITLAEHAILCQQRCPAFGQAGTCLFLSGQLDGKWVSHRPRGWPHDHGPFNVKAMVKIMEMRLISGQIFVVVVEIL